MELDPFRNYGLSKKKKKKIARNITLKKLLLKKKKVNKNIKFYMYLDFLRVECLMFCFLLLLRVQVL